MKSVGRDEGTRVAADISGNVWKVTTQTGDVVKKGDILLILEAMKMEFSVTAPCDGVVSGVQCCAGVQVQAGDTLVTVTPQDNRSMKDYARDSFLNRSAVEV